MKATNIISILRLYIEFMRKEYPEITDAMLCTEDSDENIFYMNGNDGTSFDFAVNNRLEMSRYVQSKNPLNLKYTQYRICFSE